MKATVRDRQTLADVALQYGGGLETMLELAVRNGLSLTDELREGMELEVPERPAVAAVVQRYRVKRVEPATELSAEDMAVCHLGDIGAMGIEVDFIIS